MHRPALLNEGSCDCVFVMPGNIAEKHFQSFKCSCRFVLNISNKTGNEDLEIEFSVLEACRNTSSIGQDKMNTMIVLICSHCLTESPLSENVYLC
jgi:hypothetical protein